MVDIEQKAKRSSFLLTNEFFIETFEDLREEQKTVFANSAASDIEAREEAHSIVRALNLIKAKLQTNVDTLALEERKAKHRGND